MIPQESYNAVHSPWENLRTAIEKVAEKKVSYPIRFGTSFIYANKDTLQIDVTDDTCFGLRFENDFLRVLVYVKVGKLEERKVFENPSLRDILSFLWKFDVNYPLRLNEVFWRFLAEMPRLKGSLV